MVEALSRKKWNNIQLVYEKESCNVRTYELSELRNFAETNTEDQYEILFFLRNKNSFNLLTTLRFDSV